MIGRTLWTSSSATPTGRGRAVAVVSCARVVPIALFSRKPAQVQPAAAGRVIARRTPRHPRSVQRAVCLPAIAAFAFLPAIVTLVIFVNDRRHQAGRLTLSGTGARADRELLAGLWLAVKIAFATACGAVVLGTWPPALTRWRSFSAHPFGMVAAPLVMAEVIMRVAAAQWSRSRASPRAFSACRAAERP